MIIRLDIKKDTRCTNVECRRERINCICPTGYSVSKDLRVN